jgi:hypothetical protein
MYNSSGIVLSSLTSFFFSFPTGRFSVYEGTFARLYHHTIQKIEGFYRPRQKRKKTKQRYWPCGALHVNGWGRGYRATINDATEESAGRVMPGVKAGRRERIDD